MSSKTRAPASFSATNVANSTCHSFEHELWRLIDEPSPASEKCTLDYDLELPIEDWNWNVGLVVGPSGSGKSTVLRHAWGDMPELKWGGASVVDDFSAQLKMDDIAAACSAVGFNSIPSWMRPFAVLSNGEKFRVDLARRLLELPDPIVVDEFSSVVDRQVAKIGSYAVQKFARKNKRKFVAVGCHYDILDFLNPDWVLDMATRSFTRRLLRRRPDLRCTIGRLPRTAWEMFAKYHYLTAELHRGATGYGIWCEGVLAGSAWVIPCPISSGADKGKAVWRVSRVVTLPDWQGLGLAMVLLDTLGADYAAADRRFRMYPAHPGFVRTFDRSPMWEMIKKPGVFSSKNAAGNSAVRDRMGGRPCAVFEYVGPAAEKSVLLARGL